MRRNLALSLRQATSLAALLLCALTLHAQDTYQITPNQVTMRLGESRTFRMVNQSGQAQHKVTWTLSDAAAFDSTQGDELYIYPRRAGEYRLSAHTDFATAEASVRVVDGSSPPSDAPRWVSGGREGGVTTKIMPAVPRSVNGPEMYQQTRCADGEYVAGYTADGVQLWRTKISNNGVVPSSDPLGNDSDVLPKQLDTSSKSICDLVSAGVEQQKIRDLLTERNLTFHEEGAGGHVWLVEESNAQCRLWFDDKQILSKKRKVFTTD
jgi:hypothetical protein